MIREESILDFLGQPEKYYLNVDGKIIIDSKSLVNIDDVVFYRIDRITFEDKAPRKEALENVLSAMRIEGVNFLYLIKGDKYGVSFYYGISRDLIQKIPLNHTIEELGKSVLKPSLEGNFRGSRITQMDRSETEKIIEYLFRLKFLKSMEGVPGINENNEKYQGVDRLVDVMLGDEFAFLVTAKALLYNPISQLENNIYKFYDKLVPLSKKNVQKGESNGITIVDTMSKGINDSDTNGNQNGTTWNYGKSHQESRSSSKPHGNNETRTQGSVETNNEGTYSKNSGENISHTSGTSENRTTGKNSTDGKTKNVSSEYSNKKVQEWLKYIDEVILKRLDYGKGKGMYISTISLFTMKRDTMIKLENTITSLFSGESGNRVPLQSDELQRNGKRQAILRNLQVPIGNFIHKIVDDEVQIRTALSQYITNERVYIGNWFSVNELSIIAGLPQKEVVGLALREEVEFGLNYHYHDEIPQYSKLSLGNLVQSGNILKEVPVFLDKRELAKHTFVTGVTGSGKTTTCQKILIQSNLPFLVIEPAKTEYRLLTQKYDDILIFTLGKDKVAPFRLNPFEFYPHESITSHIDMIKASIESAFDMEAAIPQIIEKALYECYKDCGWNILNDSNKYYEDPFADGVYAFPTLSELIKKTEDIVKQQGFDSRLENDYIGSIKARLQGLVLGSKGLMLNTRRSVDFRNLVHRKVILELEEIRSSTEKALIMGFILSNLTEAIKAEYYSHPDFEHITLVEEAHRLLAKYEPGDSLTKKQGVEMFSDMLAEVRKYGEALIIVDQIPSKLTTEVLKNTNTKIVHKIFAQDDKEAIGNTMALSEEQKEFLSFLDKGRAIVFSQGWDSSLQVKMISETNTANREIINEEIIHEAVLNYYCSNYKRGIYQSLSYMNTQPNPSDFMEHLKYQMDLSELKDEFEQSFLHYKASQEFQRIICKIETIMSIEMQARYLKDTVYYSDSNNTKLNAIYSMLMNVKNGKYDIGEFSEILSYGRRKEL